MGSYPDTDIDPIIYGARLRYTSIYVYNQKCIIIIIIIIIIY